MRIFFFFKNYPLVLLVIRVELAQNKRVIIIVNYHYTQYLIYLCLYYRQNEKIAQSIIKKLIKNNNLARGFLLKTCFTPG